MKDSLKVRVEMVYGRKLFYPENKLASLFASLLKKKAMSEDHMRGIVALGYSVDVIAPSFEVAPASGSSMKAD